MVCSTTMSEKQFEKLLHDQIPITKVMGFTVEEFTPVKVRLGAKLEPNVNRWSTVFGGSIVSLVTLCGWGLVYSNVLNFDPDLKDVDDVRIVVQKSTTDYILPIKSDFIAECELINKERRDRFFKTYNKMGKARTEIKVLIKDKDDNILVRFRGVYVAIKSKPSPEDRS